MLCITESRKNLTLGTLAYISEQNNALSEVFQTQIKTHEQMYYISATHLIGDDNEATIDGTHFNDLGHFRAFGILRDEITQIMRVNSL